MFHVLPLQEVIVFAVVLPTVRCISKGYGIVVLASCSGGLKSFGTWDYLDRLPQ